MIWTDNGREHVERWWHVHCYCLSRLFSRYLLCICPNRGISVCPNNGISVSKQWYLMCPNNGISVSKQWYFCVQTVVFLCVQTMVFGVSKQWYFCVSKQWYFWVFKQWYLVCPDNGISVCPNSSILCVFKQRYLCVSKQRYLVCPNNGIWCVQTMVFGVSKRWYDCQCLGFLMCGPVLMHAAAHRGCRDILETLHRKLAQRKIACCNASCVCRTWHSPSLAMALTLPTCSLHSCICARPQCSWKRSTGYKPEWLSCGLWCQEASKPENRAKRPWIITMGHRPMYCSNTDNDDCTKDESIVSQCCGFLL